jgi:ATP-dependent exoDNAse (exonuclease V) beta subunit
MPNLVVYKASAGSGKTWRLSVEMLKILINDPYTYRNILAVTFTNKATAEMKERVLGGLYEIVAEDNKDAVSPMLEAICDDLSITSDKAKAKAKLAIELLLHDYGRFRIETIDSFFQSVLRNLARELGLGAWLNIELDNEKVLADALDSVMDNASKNPELLKWITDYMQEMLSDGKSWKINSTLNDFGKSIFKEQFKDKEKQLEEKLRDKSFLKNYRNKLDKIAKEAEEKIKEPAKDFFKLLENHGYTIADLKGGANGISSYFKKINSGNFTPEDLLKKTTLQCLENPENWLTAAKAKDKSLASLVNEELYPLLIKTEEIRKIEYPQWISAKAASAHLNQIGLLSDIAAEVRQLNYDNNRFLLSDTNALFKSLLEEGDSSFIYEKTGTEINNILFDEFQDTSRMQWDTFKPLLAEGLSNGHNSLIVGDEKQSIYRWRNGDWRILGNMSSEMSPFEVKKENLGRNWRSDLNIIHFNNEIFLHLQKVISKMYLDQFEESSIELSNAYSDISQESNTSERNGLVEISFIKTGKDTSYEETVLDKLIQKTEELQRSGIKPNEIAIIIRENKYIPKIAAHFANYKTSEKCDNDLCYDIISDEAFLLESSKGAQILIDALKLLNDPQNPINQAMLKLDYAVDVLGLNPESTEIFSTQKSILPEEFTGNIEKLQKMPLHELIEDLYMIFDISRIPAQDSYLFCFMDKLDEYLSKSSADISSFIQYWDETMYKTKIPGGTAINGIRILSIHKSKGLEFHTVILPFCDWKLLSQKTSIWCQPNKEPYNELDILPVDYKKELKHSVFNEDYKEETLQLWVDALNLLYVAFTRPRHNLFVYCEEQNQDKEAKEPQKIGHLLQTLFDKRAGENSLNEEFISSYKPSDSNENQDSQEIPVSLFRYGKLFTQNDVRKNEKGLFKKGNDIETPFRSFAHKTKFRQSQKSIQFSKGKDPEGFKSKYIDRGNILHRLFSEILVTEDLDSAIKNMLNEGIIDSQESFAYAETAKKALTNPEVSDWYSGKYKIFNECSIIFPDKKGKLQQKRPDRVMISDDSVKIVDFKFGKPSPKYKAQIRFYSKLLLDMGYAKVEGFLWYVDEELVERVNL